MAKSDFEKVLSSVYENYTSIKDVHNIAYSMNSEYKKFWDNHSDERKKPFLRAQKLNSLGRGSLQYKEAAFHVATLGLSFGIKKLFQMGKPTREDKIKANVTSTDFTETIKYLNNILFQE